MSEETSKVEVVREDVNDVKADNKAGVKPKGATPKRATKAKTKTEVPKGATVPQDHRTAKDEVDTDEEPKQFEFLWNGETYYVDQEAMDDVEVMEFLTDDNTIGALRLMLQDKDWQKYKDKNKNDKGRTTASGANEFLEHIFEVLGAKNS